MAPIGSARTDAGHTPPQASASASPAPSASAAEAATMPAGSHAELFAEVTALRGLAFRRPVAVELLGRVDFARRVRASTVSSPHPSRALVARVFGLGPTRAASGGASQERYVGLYDFVSHRLIVRGDAASEGRSRFDGIVAHELVHALQDQHFGLIADGASPDEALAAEALYEGDAVLLRERLAARRVGESEGTFLARALGAIDALPGATVARAVGASQRVLGAPNDEREEALFPYLAGLRFVARLYEVGGTARIDAAFRAPPTSTMEILHPEAFLRGHKPRVLPEPPIPAGLVREGGGSLGEFRTQLVASRCRKRATLLGGLVGERFVVGSSSARPPQVTVPDALAWVSLWETEEQAAAFRLALAEARRCLPGAATHDALEQHGRGVAFVRGAFGDRAAYAEGVARTAHLGEPRATSEAPAIR